MNARPWLIALLGFFLYAVRAVMPARCSASAW